MTLHAPPTSAPAAGTPGVPVFADGELISTSPATGDEVGRFPVADADAVAAAVERAREAQRWWRGLGYRRAQERLMRWRAMIAKRMDELIDIMHAEGGKPRADAIIEIAAALDHVAWSARNAKRVLRSAPGQGQPAAARVLAPGWSTSRSA